MIFIGPPAGLTDSGHSSVAARSRPQCRAGVFARRLGVAAWQGPGTMPASSPTDAGQGPAELYKLSPPQAGNAPLRRLCRQLPLQESLFGGICLQSLPCKGRWMRRKAQTEGCGALPCQYPSGLAQAPPGGRERPPYNTGHTGGTAGDDKPPQGAAQIPIAAQRAAP